MLLLGLFFINLKKLMIFYITCVGEVQKVDQRLPVANEYLLLSGSTRDGTIDVDVDGPGELTRYHVLMKLKLCWLF